MCPGYAGTFLFLCRPVKSKAFVREGAKIKTVAYADAFCIVRGEFNEDHVVILEIFSGMKSPLSH